MRAKKAAASRGMLPGPAAGGASSSAFPFLLRAVAVAAVCVAAVVVTAVALSRGKAVQAEHIRLTLG